MPQVAYPSVAEGPLEVNSGLSFHSGVQSASCLRVTGSRNGTSVIWPRDGSGAKSGLELAHIPYGQSMIQSYDREHSLWLDLAINAKNISLAPQSGGRVTLPANTAQATMGGRWIGTWNTPAAGAWYESPSQYTITTAVASSLVRVEATGTLTHGTTNAVLYVGLGMDGGVSYDSIQAFQPNNGSGTLVGYSVVAYLTASMVAAHRFAVYLYSNTGAGGFWNGAYQYIWCTEQRA